MLSLQSRKDKGLLSRLEIILLDQEEETMIKEYLELKLAFMKEYNNNNNNNENISVESIKQFYGMFLEPYIFIAKIDLEREEKYVGFIEGKKLTFDTYWSSGVYVLPNYRSLGIAKKLKEKQIEHAKKTRCETIETLVSEENFKSMLLQISSGFEFSEYNPRMKEFKVVRRIY